MPTTLTTLLHRLRTLSAPPRHDSDAELLARFARLRDGGAFAALVGRHGPMVLNACRRMLGETDAEDAFQATFLVLARRAGDVRRPDALAGWLYGVASRVAREARRRRSRARGPVAAPEPSDPRPGPAAEAGARELSALIDDEIQRLPRAYQLPLVLCFLEGQTQEEAARRLGCSPGSVKGRLERGRALLRARLSERGLAQTPPLVLASPPTLPPALLGRTLEATAGGAARAGAVSLAQAMAPAIGGRLVALVSLFLAAGILAGVALRQPPEAKTPAALKRANDERKPPADPLPAGAIMRLGTVRFRHSGPVGVVLFSPDGKTLASASDDRTVVLWDSATGLRKAEIGYALGHQRVVCYDQIAFTPDGKTLVVGKNLSMIGENRHRVGRIELADAATGKVRTHLWGAGRKSCDAVAVSPDGKTLVATDEAGAALVWDLAKDMEKFKVALPPDVNYWAAFSADGKTLVFVARRVGNSQARMLREMAANKVRNRIATQVPGTVHVFDAESGKAREGFTVVEEGGVGSVALGPDGDTLAVVAAQRASLWSLSTRKKLRDLHPGKEVRAVALSPDGRTVALAGSPTDAKVHLVDRVTGKERLALDGWANTLAFSPDGTRLATGGLDCAVRVWDTRTGRPAVRADGPADATTCMTFSADGKTLLCGEDGGTVRLWDAATGAERSARRLRPGWGIYAGFGAVRFTPTGRALAVPNDTPQAVAGGGKVPLVWDARTGKVVLDFQPNARGERDRYVCPVELSPDGKTVARAEKDEVVLTDVATGRERSRVKGSGGLCDIRFSGDGRRLLTRSSSGGRFYMLRLWDAGSGKEVASLEDESYGSLALSPDGKVVATAGSSSVIVFWDATTGKKLRQTAAGVFEVLAFSPDGTVLASGESAGQIRLWDVATATERLALKGHRGGVRALAFAGDGRLASAGADTTVLVWDLRRAGGGKP